MSNCLAYEIAHFQWALEHRGGTTDATWIKVIFAASGAIRVLGYDMGPETETIFGHYDHGYWIDIPATAAGPFTACILHIALDHDGALNFEQLKEALSDWSVSFSEGDGPYSSELEVIA